MRRFRVSIRNAKECRIELPFPDLCVKYSNGFSPILRVKEGEEIPVEALDPEDVRKSLLTGSLKGYLENNWIEEIIEKEPVSISVEPVFDAQKLSDTKVDTSDKSFPLSASPDLKENIILEQSVPKVESITDLSKVNSYEDFNKLSHSLKLRYIKDSSDIELLKIILKNTSSNQIKNNISLRISNFKA